MNLLYVVKAILDAQSLPTEAVGAAVDEAFRTRGAERIFGNVFVGNAASRRVMEKLGFVL